jgi:hypothetical protein
MIAAIAGDKLSANLLRAFVVKASNHVCIDWNIKP